MLLGRGMLFEQAEGRPSEDVGIETLLSVAILQGLLPVERGERQHAANGPAREEAEEVAQVSPGFDVVELAAREQGDEGGVDFCGVVAADEEPVFALMPSSA
jgi:hypothetical protein